jgi:D-xylonolactonase
MFSICRIRIPYVCSGSIAETAAMPAWRIAAAQHLMCGESPVWDHRSGELLWTDLAGHSVFALDEQSGVWRTLTTAMQVGAIGLHADGGYVFGGNDGLWHWRDDAPLRPIARFLADGRPLRCNDLAVDPAGRVFCGGEYWAEGAPATGPLLRVDPGRTPVVVDDGFGIVNGIGFSPDGRTCYAVDTVPRRVWAYDYAVADGSLRHKRLFAELAPSDGLPDGMAIDAQGDLWIACWLGGQVIRLDAHGTVRERLRLPAAQCTSCAFAGPGLDRLFVTTAAVHSELSIGPPGHDYSTPRGGDLYEVALAATGLRDPLARI